MHPKTTLRTVAVAALTVISLIAGTVPATASVSSDSYRSYSAPNGLSSQYHVYANGIDWSKPVGVVFYLDGDYWNNAQSSVHKPNDGQLVEMSREANSRNMVFVPVISPDKNPAGDGITWWEDMDANGDYFRSFARQFIADSGIDPSRVWTLGYSGGAEFITYELNADRQDSWRSGGGAIIVGGGGAESLQTPAPESIKNQPMYWWVGEQDTSGQTNPPTWSARAAAESGHNTYRREGFTNTHLEYIPDQGHHGYNFSQILAKSLDEGAANTAYSDVNAGSAFYSEITWSTERGLMSGWPDRTFRPDAQVDRAALAAYLYRLSGSPEVNLPEQSPYSDVSPNQPFYKEIIWLHQQGIATGWEDGTFRPQQPMSREAMAAFFYRFHGSPEFAASGQTFSDVTADNPFYREIEWFAAEGLTTGWEDGTFRPETPTPRHAMAAFIFRYLNR